MKHRHEFRTANALGSIGRPAVWIESIRLDDFFLFPSGTVITLGRVSHLIGDVGSGKTAILQVIHSALTGIYCQRWSKFSFGVQVQLSSTEHREMLVDTRFESGNISYQLDSQPTGVFPKDVAVIFLRTEPKETSDDIEAIRSCYEFPVGLLERFIGSGLLTGVTTHSYQFRTVRTKPYLQRELLIEVGNSWVQPFKNCSSSEQARVILDVGICVASHMAKYRPVILLLDWENVWRLHMDGFTPYIDYLFSTQALFQTIFVSPDPRGELLWSGWQKIHLAGSNKGFNVDQ